MIKHDTKSRLEAANKSTGQRVVKKKSKFGQKTAVKQRSNHLVLEHGPPDHAHAAEVGSQGVDALNEDVEAQVKLVAVQQVGLDVGLRAHLVGGWGFGV